jgi:hypothetical protein
MTGRDPLTEWTADDFPDSHRPADAVFGANARLEALRPLIAAADALARCWIEDGTWDAMDAAVTAYRTIRHSKGDTP